MSPSPPPEPGVSQQGPTGGGDERYDEEEEEEDISPDLWQEACWIVIRSLPSYMCLLATLSRMTNTTFISHSFPPSFSPY